MFFIAIQQFVGEGHHQYVDDMYTPTWSPADCFRPSYADVVALDIASGEIEWRFEVDGNRSDHMAISPDGKHVAVSASTSNVVHVLDVQTGKSRPVSVRIPHENVYSRMENGFTTPALVMCLPRWTVIR